MITSKEITSELAMCKRIRDQLTKELKTMPKGSLYYKKEHGFYRPYVNRRGKETYLGMNQAELINRLIRKREIRKSVDGIDKNISILSQLETEYTDLDKLIPGDAEILLAGRSRKEMKEDFNQWAQEKAKTAKAGLKGNYYAQELITSDGIFVRSRIELIIYEFLKSRDVDFVYEKPIVIEGIEFHPDFTIRRKRDGMIILWEHFGLMDRDIYRVESRRKIQEYSKAGFWPYVNLICTYDFGDGRIDISDLERILNVMGIAEPA